MYFLIFICSYVCTYLLLGIAKKGYQELDLIFIKPMRGFVEFRFAAVSKDFH